MDNNIYQIQINDTIINNFTITSNNIITNEYNVNKLENKYNDSKLLQKTSDNKFNYQGIMSINNYNIIFYDNFIPNNSITYIKCDDNIIYPVYSQDRYRIYSPISDFIILNPYSLKFNNNNLQSFIVNKLDNDKYIYVINFKFNRIFIKSTLNTKFLIDNKIIDGIYVNSNDGLSGNLYLLLDFEINISVNNLIYLENNDYITWKISPDLRETNIISFKKVNYYVNKFNYNIQDIYYDGYNYYDCINIIDYNNNSYFYANYDVSSINFYIKKPDNTTSQTKSYVSYTPLPTINIKGGKIYPNITSQDIININTSYYVLFVDLSYNNHFMCQIKDIKNKQIPNGNYHTWILKSENLDLIKYSVNNIIIDSKCSIHKINNIPEYSYYLIRHNNNSCIYYYESGSDIIINYPLINYYLLNDINERYNINKISEMFLIDNRLFDVDMRQLIKISKKYDITENLIESQITIPNNNFSFDTTIDLIYNSNFINQYYDILNFNSNYINLNKNTETLVSLILKTENRQIYYPVILTNKNITYPNISFDYNVNNYKKSFVTILTDFIVFEPNLNSTILLEDYIVGKISSDEKCFPISQYLSITDDNTVIIKKGFDIKNLVFGLHLWKIKSINNYDFYFWTLMTNNMTIFNDYLNIVSNSMDKTSISEPCYYDSYKFQNLVKYYELIYSYPSIFNPDLTINTNILSKNIYYKYYCDTRNYNDDYTYQLLTLNYNSLHNIKPKIIYYGNEILKNINDNFYYYIYTYISKLTNQIKYFIFGQSAYNYDKLSPILINNDITELNLYVSLSLPIFIYNKIYIKQINDTLFEIYNYNKLYLEMNEIIFIDNNHFIVKGLNVFNNNYEIELITTDSISNNFNNKIYPLQYVYNGYYTIGNYLSKNNKLPSIEYNNLLKYEKTITPSIGTIYYNNNNKFEIVTFNNTTLNNVSIFNEKSLKIKLFHNNKRFYLFDNFITLKNLDLLFFNNSIYEISHIRDNQIFFNNKIVGLSDNTFYEFILPYQPFYSYYVLFDENGNILSHKFEDNTIIIIDLQIYNVFNNRINYTNLFSIYKWIRIMKTNYISDFNNSFIVPNKFTNNFNNKHSITINIEYIQDNTFKIIDNINNFNLYYLHPVIISGTFNYISSINFINSYYQITLLNNIPFISNTITLSLMNNNIYDYYFKINFRYNFGIQLYDYNNLINNNIIKVIRFGLLNDKLMTIQTDINFTYGTSIINNDKNNNINDGYDSIYFYNYQQINKDGIINNFDTLIGSYHLIMQNNKLFLIKINYGYQIKFYINFDVNDVLFIDKLIGIKINKNGGFLYSNPNIIQCKKISDIDYLPITLIKKYNINLINSPIIINNNLYHQEITFIGNTIDLNKHNTVFIDNKIYNIIYQDKKYYIETDIYISKEINAIYTKDYNYITSSINNNINKINNKLDNNIYNYLDSDFIDNDLYSQNIELLYISDYKYYLTYPYNLDINTKYIISYSNVLINITNINNDNKTIETDKIIDLTQKLYLFIDKTVNNIYYQNEYELFNNIKQLKLKILYNSKINDLTLFNYLKPWNKWGLISSKNLLSSLLNYGYISTIGLSSINTNINFDYLTNDEVKMLSFFITNINNSEISKNNYLLMKNNIEPLIFNQLNNWLSDINFFLNVQNIINDFLKNSDYDIYFNGNNIIFNNETPLYFNDEIGTYISNEYIYDDINNIVYRVNDNQINNEIDNWINKKGTISNYGVNIHQLLRYLRELGDELIKLLQDFSNELISSPDYLYNNSLKFIINKIWEKYNLQNLDKNFNDKLVITNTTNIISSLYSSINYLQNQTIVYYGLNSQYLYNPLIISEYNENTIEYLTIDNYKPIVIQNKLITNPIFKYKINFNNNVISSNSNYYINIGYEDIPITKYEIYPDQLNFELEYNINSNDFIIVEKDDNYSINDHKYLGKLYQLTFDNIDYNLIETIYNKNNKLYIDSINNYINIITINELTNNFEIINNTTIKKITNIDDKYYLDFYSITFNYISNKTLLKSNDKIYVLNKDDKFYINENITNLNVEIIIMVSGYIFDKNLYVNQYYTNLILNDSMNIIPFNFSIDNIIPNNIKINNNNILFYNDTLLTTTNDIKYKQQLGFINMNKIININVSDEYLYYFNYSIPHTSNTVLYLYDNNDNILDDNNVKKSIYTKFTNTQTFFTVNGLYNDVKFVQINKWNITNYKLNGSNIELSLPLDFIFNSSNKYYYKINDKILNKSTFIIYNNLIIINWNHPLPESIIFKQYYVENENNKILIPDNNRKINIIYETPYQFENSNNYIIIPYTNKGERFYRYLYKIKINENINSKNINLLLNGNNIQGLIFNKLKDNYYIISLKNKIDLSYNYTYYLEDLIIKSIDEISYYQESLEFGDFYYQDNINEINIFMRNNMNNYEFIDNNENRFYLINYIKYEITNLYYPNKFIQKNNLKKINNYEYKVSKTIEKPIFSDYKKLFSHIKLFMNDQLLEELNEDTFNIHRYLYCTEEKRRQLDKLTQIRFINNNWEIYIPFHFWYCNNAGKSIPTISLPNSDLRLFYKLNELSYVLDNDLSVKYKTSIRPYVRFELMTDFILLEMEERKLFGSYSHEYVIERYKIYNKSYVSTKTTILKNNFSGLIKDIHLIVKLIKNPNINCYQEITNDFDYRYNDYIIALKYYNLYIINNIYTSIEQKNYSKEIDIIKNNLIELSNGSIRINRLTNNFNSWKYWSNDFLKFLMYYEDKYLKELNDIQKIYVVSMYLKYLYKNNVNIKETSLIHSLLIKINGTDLLSEQNYSYFTDLIPTQKFKNSLPIGYYSYTFSLYPNDDQYSGHLNFTHFDDTIIKVSSNDLVSTNPYMINTVVKEYNILRVMSGMASLAWID